MGYMEQVSGQSEHLQSTLARANEVGLSRGLFDYYYISHYYPLKAMEPCTPKQFERMLGERATNAFETYIHFPYCEQLCTFCHFFKGLNTGDYDTKETDALELVLREIGVYNGILGGKIPARSIQFGGGTPSLISNSKLASFLDKVHSRFELESDAEIKFEIYPKTYAPGELEEKLAILKDAGITDLVVDLESGNRQSLDLINRKNSSLEEYLEVVSTCVRFGFENIVTALIAGLPYETEASMVHTLDALTEIEQVRVINTFPLVVRDFDPIAKQIIRDAGSGVNTESREHLWLLARDHLRSKGLVEGPISYFHPEEKRPEQQADKFECVNLLGFGASSFGYINGKDWAAQYYNHCSFSDYEEAVVSDQVPVWRAGRMNQEERARRKLIFGLANVKVENLIDLETIYDVDVDDVFGQTLNALLELELIRIDIVQEGITYTEAGLCRLEEITYFLGSNFVRNRTDEKVEVIDAKSKALRNHHYTVTMPAKNRHRFEKFVEKQPRAFMNKIRQDE